MRPHTAFSSTVRRCPQPTSSLHGLCHPCAVSRPAAWPQPSTQHGTWCHPQQEHGSAGSRRTSMKPGSRRTTARLCMAVTSASVGAQQAHAESTKVDADEVAAAWTFLKEFTVKTFRGLSLPYTSTPEKRAALRNALLLVYHHPWPAAGWVPPKPPQAQPPSPAPTPTPLQEDVPLPAQQPASGAATAPTPPAPSAGAAAGALSTAAAGQAVPQSAGPDAGSAAGGASGGLVMIGLMAGDVRLGARAMRDYCAALGLPFNTPESRVPGVSSVAAIQGSVYFKYNSQSQVCYVSPYFGKERGVLVQLGVEQLGHFPLGLFDEAMAAPPPVL